MQISEAVGGAPESGAEPCRFPKLEECAHFHYERVQLPPLTVTIQTNMDQSLHSQHTNEGDEEYYMVQVTSGDECWLLQRNLGNFRMLDAQLHQCIYDRKISQLSDLSSHSSYGEDTEILLASYLEQFSCIADNSLNCGPVLNWLQMDNKGHRLLVPSEESRSINTPAVAAAYSVRRYVSQARDELNLEVGDMISVIDMASPGESMWWRGKRGFQVGFFPQHCVHIIGDKVPRNMPLPPPVVGSLALSPIKPVLRKHGKLIAFFRSFILNRPSRRRLKQSGILKERVFGCDLGEHLLNSGHDIPTVLKCCAEFIEKNGIVDGIYRLSGVTSNIQKLRNAFDEDRIPNLYTEEILQDIHSVASLLKMYFRELPNPLCTYQLYQSFVNAVQGCNTATRNSENDHDRLLKMRESVQKLPPPHYRTLEYLMRHLARVAKHGASTGMTTRNVAIVWAPNLLRSEELEGGGVAALQGVGVQAVVTEFLICYTDLIFCDHLPILDNSRTNSELLLSPKRSRPKSLAISTPTKLITLEEARTKHQVSKGEDCNYIEVGGGPENLPKKYHTIIELPTGRKRGHSKRSPSGWRSFFSKSRNSSQNTLIKNRKASTPSIIIADKCVTESNLNDLRRKLRTVKSAESLTSGLSEPPVNEVDVLGPLHTLCKPPGHNRSVSHDSYFDTLQSSQNNSEGSLLDLSEIHLNFDLEESEMRIFSEDESLVSSPRVQKDMGHRKYLSRARPEDFSSASNSNNPSPKKQARVVVSPDSLSRKRTRLEDQLPDIQYIDCNTPDNPSAISTTAIIHLPEVPCEVVVGESYQPKNKSPRNSQIEAKRQSLNLEPSSAKLNIPKSLTEVNLGGNKLVLTQSSTFATPTPQSPVYRPLVDSSAATTPGDFSPCSELKYPGEMLGNSERPIYENVVVPYPRKPKSPTYENVLTTISITYKSPTKRFSSSSLQSTSANSNSIYEDVSINPEKAEVPSEPAILPTQGANQPKINDIKLPLPANETRPKSLSALEELKSKENSKMRLNLSSSAVCNSKSETRTISTNNGTLCRSSETTLNSSVSSDFNVNSNNSSVSAAPVYHFNEYSPTDMSLSEVVQSSSENVSANLSCPATPTQNSLSPNVSPSQLFENLDLGGNDKTDGSPCSLPVLKNYEDSIEFGENEAESRMDKRKSSETIDDNSIYQQVKYFRRSVHEINALLDLEHDTESPKDSSSDTFPLNQNSTDDNIEFDSLETDSHIYENVKNDDTKEDYCEKVSVKNLTNKFEVLEAKPPACVKPDDSQKSSKNRLDSFTEKICNLVAEKTKEDAKIKEPLPPCLRARNLKQSIKTRSLDENEFNKEFGSFNIRRKSLDENLSLSEEPKTLGQPKQLPPETEKLKIHTSHTFKTVPDEQKLNRERIEKYKEERRKILHEKYRSESFKEDKDVLLCRLKIKMRDDDTKKTENRKKDENKDEPTEVKLKIEDTPPSLLESIILDMKPESLKSRAAKFELRHEAPAKKNVEINPKKNADVKTSSVKTTELEIEDFLRNRRRNDDVKNERRWHSYEMRERDDAERFRRVSLDSKSPRKEKTSPSLCIKDMKAIFESKSQQ